MPATPSVSWVRATMVWPRAATGASLPTEQGALRQQQIKACAAPRQAPCLALPAAQPCASDDTPCLADDARVRAACRRPHACSTARARAGSTATARRHRRAVTASRRPLPGSPRPTRLTRPTLRACWPRNRPGTRASCTRSARCGASGSAPGRGPATCARLCRRRPHRGLVVR